MNKPRLTIEIDKDLRERAKAKAYAEKTTLKDKIIKLINAWLNKEIRR